MPFLDRAGSIHIKKVTWIRASSPAPESSTTDALVVLPAFAGATTTIRLGFDATRLPLLPPY